MKQVQFRISEDDLKKIDDIKFAYNLSTRTEVVRFLLSLADVDRTVEGWIAVKIPTFSLAVKDRRPLFPLTEIKGE